MEIWKYADYRELIREEIRHSQLTLKRISQNLGMQYTYLSKALGRNSSAHLSEDALFGICKQLNLLPGEIEFVRLLRSWSMASNPQLRTYLKDQIERVRREAELRAPVETLDLTRIKEQMDYLLDPLCLIAVMALNIEDYRKHPERLCGPLGIDRARLEVVLNKLHAAGFISYDRHAAAPNRISLTKTRFHFGTDHPFMRSHQLSLPAHCVSHVMKISESDAQSRMVTFSGNPETFEHLRREIKETLQRAEIHVSRAKSRSVYQLNIDLFKWF